MNKILHKIGAPLYEELETWSHVGILLIQTLKHVPRRASWRVPEITHCIVQNGIGSLPVIILSTAFAGIVLTNQIAWHMRLSLHDVSMIPGFTGQFILRELGVAIPATLLVSKAGAAMTAEVGSMKVTEQIDALKLLGIDPVTYLVFPKFVASIVSGACLTLVAVSVTLGCAIAVAVSRYNFSSIEFLNALRHFVGARDLICALVKGTVFGAAIPIISCTYGFRCKGGAEGVGSATTNSVVSATIAIILLDFLLTYVFTFIL
jgi:phospholipid/cholesterol/gamma-HCH transport system permease protein